MLKIIIIPMLIAMMLLSGCNRLSRRAPEVLHLKGSFTMLELGNMWAQAYMESHPGTSVYVEGGGSATGFQGLLDGEIDIALSSRLILTEEAQALAAKYNSIGLSFLVAKDALSVLVNKENPLSNLTIEQVRDIFTGTITNWSHLGGWDQSIQVAIRPPTSGTHLYFKEFVLDNAEYSSAVQILPTNSAIANFVQDNPSAIGHSGIEVSDAVTHCQINGIAARRKNVREGRYPLSRYLYLYTIQTPSGKVKQFIDWVISPAGQMVVSQAGFISLWSE
jgi:phosphate transport system substrate-binding protein